ncbi:MAG: OmpH family outer membrane protein [Bacteroidota bacterium]
MLKNNKRDLLIIVNSILIVALVIYMAAKEFTSSNETVYIDNIKLFDGFIMTQEMKKVGEKEFNSRKSILDTLYTQLQNPKIAEPQKKAMMQQFIQGKEALEEFNREFANSESSKIWSRINTYIGEYSKHKNYQLILGSENKRNVLFAAEESDKTSELLLYINKKYEGIK